MENTTLAEHLKRQQMEQEPRSTTKTSDTLILIYLIYASAAFLINFILNLLPEASTQCLSQGLYVIGGMTPILLALAIKNKTGKIIGIVLSSVLTTYHLYIFAASYFSPPEIYFQF